MIAYADNSSMVILERHGVPNVLQNDLAEVLLKTCYSNCRDNPFLRNGKSPSRRLYRILSSHENEISLDILYHHPKYFK